MKKYILLPCALLFSLSACRTTREQVELQQGHDWVASDSLAKDSAVVHRASDDSSAIVLGAAFVGQQSATGAAVEVDTSRTVIVTEFGQDGQPIRQTETRQTAISRRQDWSQEQRLQIDLYMQQMQRLRHVTDSLSHMLVELSKAGGRDTTSYRSERKPSAVVPLSQWTVVEIVALLVVVIGPIVLYLWSKRCMFR